MSIYRARDSTIVSQLAHITGALKVASRLSSKIPITTSSSSRSTQISELGGSFKKLFLEELRAFFIARSRHQKINAKVKGKFIHRICSKA